MTRAIVKLIEFYQHYLSPDHSFWGASRYPFGYCRFSPTCSEYAKQALRNRGFIKGISLGVWRIIRCNPLSEPGIDPVYKK